MSNKILVTDSLFIFDEHVKKLEEAGYEVERLDKPQASEEELCQAVKGKTAYILGGIEKITDKVIEAADNLQVIDFTGADWKFFIPGWQKAFDKGIKIATTPASNSFAVAEFALAVALAMQRNLFELGRTGDKKFETTGSFKNSKLGVIGAGNIGSRIITMAKAFQPAEIAYYSRSQKDNSEDIAYKNLDKLLAESDVIFVSVPETAGMLLDSKKIEKINSGALIVSVSPLSVVDMDALLVRLQNGEVRVAVDWPAPTPEFDKLPLGTWFNTNDHTAFNTHQANKLASDMAVESILNMLAGKKDKFEVS